MLKYFSKKKSKPEKEEEAKGTTKLAPTDAAQPLEASAIERPTIETKSHTNGQPPHEAERNRRSSVEEPPLSPVLDKEDEQWLKSILEVDNGPPPPLPARPSTLTVDISDSDVGSDAHDSDDGKTKGKDKDKKKAKKDKEKKNDKAKDKDKDDKPSHRFSSLFARKKHHGDALKPEDASPAEDEEEREKKDLTRVLDRLNLGGDKNNKLMTTDSAALLKSFTNIFKDLANGVPTACNDLVKLFDDREGTINRGFEKLPSSLQRLVTQLPEKLTATIAPELLAAAAKSQGLTADSDGNIKDAAMKLLTPQNLTELVTKPGAMVSMLQAIVNALKLRWPAFIGTSAIVSVALFILMFVLWYCHKRGREVRLEKEDEADRGVIDGRDRIEELPDDPMLPAPADSSNTHPAAASTRVRSTEVETTHPAAMRTGEAPRRQPSPEPVSPLSVEVTNPLGEREPARPVSR